MSKAYLSSDILEHQFGPTAVKVICQDGAMRVIQTVAQADGQVLELSLARFLPEGPAKFPEIHKSVLGGESMGKAFRRAGARFHRQEHLACRYAVPPAIKQLFRSNQSATIVSVAVLVGTDKTPYANIIEVYSGQIVWPKLSGSPTQEALKDLDLLEKICLHFTPGLD